MSTELSNGGERSKRKRGNDWVRKRVSLACDPCRKKKLKCDGARPFCSTCVSLGRKCLFEDAVKKRGLPEGYVRGLETLLGLLQSPGSSIEGTSKLFETALEDETAKRNLIETWNESGIISSETFAEKWRGSMLCKALESLLPTLDSGDLRGQDFKKPRMEPHAVGDEGRVNSSQIGKLKLPPREEAEDLLMSYFTYTNSWLPIISKDELLASYYQALELTENSIGPGENTVLWAVLAYGQHQKESVTGGNGMIQLWPQSSKSRSFYEKTTSLILSGGFELHIGYVQALLVLSLIKVGLGQCREAWLVVNEAINIAIDLGANDISSLAFQAAPDKYKRVFFGCFYLDTMLAACLNRIPRFRKEDVISMGLLAENGLEEWGHLDFRGSQAGAHPVCSRSISIYNHLLRMMCVLSDSFHKGFSTEKNDPQTRTMFENWRASLPPYCTIDASINRGLPDALLPPHVLNLRITFLISSLSHQRRYGISTNATLAEAKALCQAVDTTQSRYASEFYRFPPTFCLIIKLALQDSCPHEQRWASGRKSLIEYSSKISIPSHLVEQLPKNAQLLSTPLHGTDQNCGVTPLPFTSVFDDSKASDNCISSLDVIATINTKLQSDTPDHSLGIMNGSTIDGYLFADPASDLANDLQDQGAEANTALRRAHLVTSEPLPPATGTASELTLQDMDFADDYFFELSNLDQLAGNQDETYRNLGFLLDANDPDPVANSNNWQLPENDQVGTHTPDEWSHWFGQLDGT